MENKSKNEPVDKTVDHKLEKWREHSILLEKERQREEQEKRDASFFYRMFSDYKKQIITGGLAIVALLFVVVLVVTYRMCSGVSLSQYITVSYTGANGYASAHPQMDSERLLNQLTKGKTDTADYETLVQSLQLSVTGTNISNKEKLTVTVTFDEELAKKLGVKFKNRSYHIKAKGIKKGTDVDLFADVSVMFVGISPEAQILIENHSEDEYLRTLSFEADKETKIQKGDAIVISCTADYAEIAGNGYLPRALTATITADKLSTYVENEKQIEKEVLQKIDAEATAAIVEETQDTTFRMLYRATGDTAYLRYPNNETAQNIELQGRYFLKRKAQTDEQIADNYLYVIYAADVEAGTQTETVYFAFSYTDSYMTAADMFELDTEYAKKRYMCDTDLDALWENCIETKSDMYTITQIY